MQKQSDQPSASEGNLMLAVILLTVFAGLASIVSAYTAGFVLDQIMNSPEAMVMIVVDGAIKSDSAARDANVGGEVLLRVY